MNKPALTLLSALTLLLSVTACDTTPQPQPEPTPTGTPVNSLADSGPGSLRQAMLDAKPGDTLRLTVKGTVNLSAPLKAGRDLTIIADGVTFDTGGQDRALEIPAGINVTVQGGTLRGGAGQPLPTALAAQATPVTATVGGVILNQGTLTLENTGVQGGNANLGGGIYNAAGATLTLDNASVTGNTATPSPDPNVTSGAGGGIYSAGTLNLNGTVSGNTAEYAGGGVRSVSGSVFNMTGGRISGNRCTYLKDLTTLDGCFGGGLYLNGSGVISGGTLAQNSATIAGGGILLGTRADGSPATLTISGNSTVIENNSAYGGGGILSVGTLKLTDGTVRGNTTTSAGGGINIRGGTFDFSGGSVESNISSDSVGGGVYITSLSGKTTTASISGHALIKGNQAVEGAGLNVSAGDPGATSVVMTGGIIKGNSATRAAGGVNIGQVNFFLQGGDISGNTAVVMGGGLSVGNRGVLTMTGGTVRNNTVTSLNPGEGNGGGLRLYAGASVDAQGGEISGNTAWYGAGVFIGAAYNSTPAATFTLAGATVKTNQTTGTPNNGGGFFNDGTLNITAGQVVGNSAGRHGGGVYNSKTALYSMTSGSVNANTPDDVYTSP